MNVTLARCASVILFLAAALCLAGCNAADEPAPRPSPAPIAPAAAASMKVTQDHLVLELPLSELQRRPGEPMVTLNGDRRDGGAVAFMLIFDPQQDPTTRIEPARVLIDAAQHTLLAFFYTTNPDGSTGGGPVFLESARVENDRLILLDSGEFFAWVAHDQPDMLHWSVPTDDPQKEPRVIGVTYDRQAPPR